MTVRRKPGWPPAEACACPSHTKTYQLSNPHTCLCEQCPKCAQRIKPCFFKWHKEQCNGREAPATRRMEE